MSEEEKKAIENAKEYVEEDIVPIGIQEILKLAEDEGYIEIVKE